MVRCMDKRKVRTKIPSHFRNVWKCMDKKILKPLKKADFALPATKKMGKPARHKTPAKDHKRPTHTKKRARPLPPDSPLHAPIALDDLGPDENAALHAPPAEDIIRDRRRARQFRREEFPMKNLQIKLKKLPPLPKGREHFPIKLVQVARGTQGVKKPKTKTKKPKKELQIKLKKLPHLPGGKARLPPNFDYSRIKNKYRKKPATVEVGERLRVKLPSISKKLKAIKGRSKNVPIDLESSPEYVLQDPTPAPTVLQHLNYHRPVRKFAAQTPMQASQYFKN